MLKILFMRLLLFSENNRVLINKGISETRQWLLASRSVLFLLVDVVVQQFDDQVDMCQDHASAAVPLATKLVKSLAVAKEKLVLSSDLQDCGQAFTYDVDTFWWSIKSKYLFHLLPTTYVKATINGYTLECGVHKNLSSSYMTDLLCRR